MTTDEIEAQILLSHLDVKGSHQPSGGTNDRFATDDATDECLNDKYQKNVTSKDRYHGLLHNPNPYVHFNAAEVRSKLLSDKNDKTITSVSASNPSLYI